MSLDVYLKVNYPVVKNGSGIFIRQNGRMREINHAEWDEMYPDREPATVLDSDSMDTVVFSANITHNLAQMAREAGIHRLVWRPDENGVTVASQLIEPLTEGLKRLKESPEYFKAYNPENGWGSYEVLIEFVEEYLAACREYPEATISVWR